MRVWVAIGCAIAFGAACSQRSGDTPASESPVAAPAHAEGRFEAVDLAAMSVPSPVPHGQDLMAGIRAGQSATLRTDACAEPRAATEAALMSIVCDGEYTVFWDVATSRWGAIGPNKTLIEQAAQQTVSAFMNPGPTPADQRIIVIWGMGLLIDAQNQASLADGKIVGHLVHTPSAEAQNTTPASGSPQVGTTGSPPAGSALAPAPDEAPKPAVPSPSAQ